MSYAERNDMIFIKRMKFTRALIHDIQNFKKKTLK